VKEPSLYKYFVKPIFIFFTKVILRPTIVGIDNIPDSSNYILAGNHTNYLDCVLLIALNKKVVHFLAKDSLFKGFKGLIFKRLGIVPVNRKIHDKNALNEAIKLLNDNKVIGIFPEGTINRSNDLILPFKIGAVKMASVTNTSIVPFVITGSYFKKDLKIEFLNNIKVEDKKDLTSDNEKLMNIIKDKLK